MSLTLDPIQKEAMEAAPALRPLMEEVGRAVWELAEVGLTEYRSAGFVADVLRRDENDTSRAVAPLRPAEDAVVLVTTGNTFEQSRELLLKTIKERL